MAKDACIGSFISIDKLELLVINELNHLAAEYSKGIRELYMDKAKGLLSESDYPETSKDFTTARDRLERKPINQKLFLYDCSRAKSSHHL